MQRKHILVAAKVNHLLHHMLKCVAISKPNHVVRR